MMESDWVQIALKLEGELAELRNKNQELIEHCRIAELDVEWLYHQLREAERNLQEPSRPTLNRDLGAPTEEEWDVLRGLRPYSHHFRTIRAKVDAMVKRHAEMFDCLTSTQQRCTELVEENRRLRVSWGEWVLFAGILHAVEAARLKHPPTDRKTYMLALQEECGELAKELLEGGSEARICEEARQVACVAVRLMVDATDRAK